MQLFNLYGYAPVNNRACPSDLSRISRQAQATPYKARPLCRDLLMLAKGVSRGGVLFQESRFSEKIIPGSDQTVPENNIQARDKHLAFDNAGIHDLQGTNP